jgi:hypothetical protein
LLISLTLHFLASIFLQKKESNFGGFDTSLQDKNQINNLQRTIVGNYNQSNIVNVSGISVANLIRAHVLQETWI